MYQVLAKDYLEYSVDMSINELNVHWCGHSEHIIGYNPVFKEIASGFEEVSVSFYKYLKDMI